MAELIVTMGDPAGVGPEVTLRALAAAADREMMIVVGEADWLRETADQIGGAVAGLQFREGDPAAESGGAGLEPGVVRVFNPLKYRLSRLERGRDWAEFGDASFKYVVSGVAEVMKKPGRALVTAPISKHAWHLAGHDYPGHTELIRDLSGSTGVGMMFWGDSLKVLLVTTHLPLARVPAAISPELVTAKLRLLHEFMRRAGLDGDIGLAALNPHAGENGAFGDEEARILEPAVAQLRAGGLPVIGPLPADTLFYQARQGRFAVVAALYHDQGLGPFKMLHFHDGVNLSIGLPFIRTSADHGTAFDISTKFIADSQSMEKALSLAHKLSREY
ncbi:MAG: 4-hydroxythreonine-4-phosphate dehydrogenase PdxA [Deltaproteobacteria bacterium]|nr:4-hydroxythreonine-4-phosphate dehydrogenase PdxA [Deltaproteobacteria bacterium]